jgi:hypothetical protein
MLIGAAFVGLLIVLAIAQVRQSQRTRRRLEALAAANNVSTTPLRQAAAVRRPGTEVAGAGDEDDKGPLQVHFLVTRPAREVTISCGPDLLRVCRKHCTVTLPAPVKKSGAAEEGQCIASAPGFGSQAVSYSGLRSLAGKHGKSVRQKLALVPIK